MQTSQLQLRQCLFHKVLVEAFEVSLPPKHSLLQPFNFSGVAVRVAAEMGIAEGEQADPRHFSLRMTLKIENKDGKPSPYNIELDATGLLEISPNVAITERYDFVVINGSALVYGAFREMVSAITSRSSSGPAVLPSVTFIDHKSSIKPKTAGKKPRARKRSSAK